MLTYTAHRKAELLREQDVETGILFIKDGFSWLGFLVPVLWLAWHRLWLALVGYLVAVAVLAAVGFVAGFPDNLATGLGLLLNLFFGLEGNNFRRRSLARRGFQETADIVAGDKEEAAWRFFALRAQQQDS